VTEQEWLVCNDPQPMIEALHGKVSVRKLRLFTCACCRRIWHLLTDERSRGAIEVGERYADGLATDFERLGWRAAAMDVSIENLSEEGPETAEGMAASAVSYVVEADENFCRSPEPSDWQAASEAAGCVRVSVMVEVHPVQKGASSRKLQQRALNAERDAQVLLLRDVFRNPFRPVTLDPAWKTPAILQLAQSLYEERRFEDMPVLADALEEAGCQDAAVLGHCRGPGPHVRGCWVLDLILGKE
jgi:hypothetical protein